MANELTAEDIDWGLSRGAPPDGGVKDERLSLALTAMHKLQLTNGRDRERLIQAQDHNRDLQRAARARADADPGPTTETREPLFRTARELCDAAPATAEWVVKGYAAEHSLTELTGLPKEAGKTSFLMGLVRTVLDGDTFMDQPTSQGPVVYVTEEKASTFRAALRRADLSTRRDLHVLSYWDALNLGWPGICDAAERRCGQDGARLLVIDTLSQCAGFTGEQESASGDANAALLPLQQIAHRLPLAVIVVRHDRKSGGRVGQSGRGSGAFTAGVDIVLHLGRPEGQGQPTQRVLTALSRYEETPAALLLDRIVSAHPSEGVGAESKAAYEWVSLGEPRAIAHEQSETKILEVLPTNEADALTIDELVEATGCSRRTSQRVLVALATGGQMSRIGEAKRGNPYRYFKAVQSE